MVVFDYDAFLSLLTTLGGHDAVVFIVHLLAESEGAQMARPDLIDGVALHVTAGASDVDGARSAELIVNAFSALAARPWSPASPADLLPILAGPGRELAVGTLMGIIGSVIFLVRHLLSRQIKGQAIETGRLTWYLFRPLLGATMGLSVVLVAKSAVLLIAAPGAGTAVSLYMPALALLGLFAGLLSWQSLDLITTKGLESMRPAQPQWAIGLAQAMASSGVDAAALAERVGVSQGQIVRWVDLKDQVTPEMQDRLSTTLDVPPPLVFKDTLPRERERARQHVRLIERDVRALSDALSPKPSVRYEGHICADLLDADGRSVIDAETGAARFDRGSTRLRLFFADARPASGLSAPIAIKEGLRAEHVPFTVSLDVSEIGLESPPDWTIDAPARGFSASRDFSVDVAAADLALIEEDEPTLYVRVAQHGKRVQELLVRLSLADGLLDPKQG